MADLRRGGLDVGQDSQRHVDVAERIATEVAAVGVVHPARQHVAACLEHPRVAVGVVAGALDPVDLGHDAVGLAARALDLHDHPECVRVRPRLRLVGRESDSNDGALPAEQHLRARVRETERAGLLTVQVEEVLAAVDLVVLVGLEVVLQDLVDHRQNPLDVVPQRCHHAANLSLRPVHWGFKGIYIDKS